MLETLGALFSSDRYMPHGMCFLWEREMLWLHVTSDAVIALAYYSIPFSLIWFIFWLLIMAPLGGIANVEEFAAFSAIMGIFGGLILMVSSLIFLKKELPSFAPQQLYGQSQHHMPAAGYSALPPQQSVPASAYTTPSVGRWRDTNDLEPSSVTESTTRLLKQDEH